MRILLVEDDDSILLLARTVLTSEGHDVVVARNVKQAKGCDWSQVDILVTDHMMPNATGADLVRWARREHPHVRSILTTAAPLSNANAITGVADATVSKGDWPYALLDALGGTDARD